MSVSSSMVARFVILVVDVELEVTVVLNVTVVLEVGVVLGVVESPPEIAVDCAVEGVGLGRSNFLLSL